MPPRHGLTSADAKSLEAFHMKCQRRILRISWRQFVRNLEISALTGLPDINDVIRHRRIAVFGHIARLQNSTPAHKALQSHVNLSLGRLPHPSWSRRPGRPRGRWIDKSETTPARHLPTSGDRSLDAVIMDERRDGLRWLCDDDDYYYCSRKQSVVHTRWRRNISP